MFMGIINQQTYLGSSRHGLLHEDGPCAVHEEQHVAVAEKVHGALQGAVRQEQQASAMSPRLWRDINGKKGKQP